MTIIETTEKIRRLAHAHGRYRELAKSAGVGYEWLSKFSTGKIRNPCVTNVAALEEFFSVQPVAFDERD